MENKQDQPNFLNNTNSKQKNKSKQQIDKEHYQRNKEKKKQQRRERYQARKQLEQEKSEKYYGAESIRVLLSLKNYTELSQQKYKLWADFCWTLKDINQEISGIISLMKLNEATERLINDYWATVRTKVRPRKHWNSLPESEQQKLIRYWGYEKARREKQLNHELKELEQQALEQEKEIELAKFHEERGKINCECWHCSESKRLSDQAKQEQDQYWNEPEPKPTNSTTLSDCANCGEQKRVDTDSGLCRGCSKILGE